MVHISGHVQDLAATTVTLEGTLFDKNGDGVDDFTFSAPVTVAGRRR